MNIASFSFPTTTLSGTGALAELPARLAKLKAQLEDRDRKTGERDRILHRLLDGAAKDLQAAKTAEDRKAVAAQLDDLQAQLKQ